MFFVIAATSRSPARSWTRGASRKTNGRRTSRLVLSVGRFFTDRVAKTDLSSLNHACEQAAQTHRRTFRRIGYIQRGFSIPPLKFFTTRMRGVSDFQQRLADTQTRARGQVVLMQVEINDQVVASEIHAFGFPGDGFQKPGIHYRNLHERIGVGLQVPTVTSDAAFRAENRLCRRLTLFVRQPNHEDRKSTRL